MKIKCPDCDFVASHKTNYVKALLGRHRAKHHGYVSPGAKYYKKNQQPRNPEVQTENPQPKIRKQKLQLAVNFCPGCGCNLRAVAVALNLGGKL